jgi:hypothetical protein
LLGNQFRIVGQVKRPDEKARRGFAAKFLPGVRSIAPG